MQTSNNYKNVKCYEVNKQGAEVGNEKEDLFSKVKKDLPEE